MKRDSTLFVLSAKAWCLLGRRVAPAVLFLVCCAGQTAAQTAGQTAAQTTVQAAIQDTAGTGDVFETSFTAAAPASEANLVKMNLTALPLRNFSFQYERILNKRFTVGGGLRFMPKGGLPLPGSLESLIDDEDTYKQLQGAKLGNIALTAEARYYVGKHGALRGFYIAPYARFASYQASIREFEYTVENEESQQSETKSVPIDGKLSAITGGLLFGAQWKLSKKLYLDWWILGPSIGSANGDLSAVVSLNEEDQEALREELEELGEDIPMVETSTTVDGNGARTNVKGPWAGLRAGLSLGIRF